MRLEGVKAKAEAAAEAEVSAEPACVSAEPACAGTVRDRSG